MVERHKHQFNGGYMPVIGTDATVWSDQLDFRFQNNTDYPIKIESYLDKNHKLHVTIYGTDTTGIHGEPYHVVISTVPYKNTYQPKDSIPVGTEPQRDPNYSRYNGYTVDLYQKLVDKNGKTISTTLLYRNTYKASDAVYYYNPADAARWGIDPSTGLKTLTPVTPTPSPSPSPSPAPSPTPGGTPSPVPTATPVLPLEPSPTVPPSPESPPAYTPPVEATATPESGVGPGMEPVEETPPPAPTPADTPAAAPAA
ncbi:MAG: VanW family protein [Flavonifractor plautii]